MEFVNECEVEHRAATNADALETALECFDIEFGNLTSAGSPSLPRVAS
jgi:hypothetical protein